MMAAETLRSRISVIVPVYRTERYLGQCLASVASQTCLEWECVVVDDGSEDPETIEALARQHLGRRGRVLHQENQGLPAARNRGIVAASGNLILCLDSDDTIAPEYLHKTRALMDHDPGLAVVCCWTQHTGLRSDVLQPGPLELFWLLQRNLFPVTALFCRRVWEEVDGFDERMTEGHEDWEFWIRVALAGNRFGCVPEPLFHYRLRSGSMVSNATRKRAETIHYIRRKHAGIYFLGPAGLLGRPEFRHVPRRALARFWLTGLFFRYLPGPARRALFGAYAAAKDRFAR